MSTEIYYFSGTGNSLHVARELQKRLPGTALIPLVSLLNKTIVETKSDTVGFIFPIHFSTVPIFLKDIIKKFDFRATNYIFAVATRLGTPCSTAFTKIEKILHQKGQNLNASLILNMPSNDPKFKGWHQSTPEEIAQFEVEVQDRLNSFQNIVLNKVNQREKDTHILFPINKVMEHLGALMAEIPIDGGKDFFADEKCSGCGLCEKVCLSQKVKMINQKPVWQKQIMCFSCYACLNFCPIQSVQMRSGRLIKFYTAENGRYTHPEVTATEIGRQKDSL